MKRKDMAQEKKISIKVTSRIHKKLSLGLRPEIKKLYAELQMERRKTQAAWDKRKEPFIQRYEELVDFFGSDYQLLPACRELIDYVKPNKPQGVW